LKSKEGDQNPSGRGGGEERLLFLTLDRKDIRARNSDANCREMSLWGKRKSGKNYRGADKTGSIAAQETYAKCPKELVQGETARDRSGLGRKNRRGEISPQLK